MFGYGFNGSIDLCFGIAVVAVATLIEALPKLVRNDDELLRALLEGIVEFDRVGLT